MAKLEFSPEREYVPTLQRNTRETYSGSEFYKPPAYQGAFLVRGCDIG